MSLQYSDIAAPKLRRLSMATRGAYFIAGFTVAAWAPLVPYAKVRSDLSDGALGLLLLCLGLGSVILMPLTGMLTSRFGCRKVITVLTLLGCITLPLLALLDFPLALGLALLFFGAAAGGLDVSSCIQAIMVQKESGRQIMPAMLAFYSIGNIAGPSWVSLLLYCGLSPFTAALCSSGVILAVLLFCQRDLAPKQTVKEEAGSLVVFPRGAVLFLGSICFTVFLVEGAMMDWGSLFLINYKGFDESYGGIGFAVFSAAIAFGRMLGERLIRLVGGETRMILFGCLMSFCGFLLTLFVLPGKMVLVGFCLIGFGNANVIPLLFSAAGKQKTMPAAAAVSAVTTLGYSGILIGPAFIGFLAQLTTLFWAFSLLGVLMLVVALLSKRVP